MWHICIWPHFLTAADVNIHLPWGMKFSREFNFADFRFFEFRGSKFSRIWISDITTGTSCMIFESYKNGSHMVVFVTLFATSFIEIQQCLYIQKKQIITEFFFGGSLFQRDFIFADRWKIREITVKLAKIGSHEKFRPHDHGNQLGEDGTILRSHFAFTNYILNDFDLLA